MSSIHVYSTGSFGLFAAGECVNQILMTAYRRDIIQRSLSLADRIFDSNRKLSKRDGSQIENVDNNCKSRVLLQNFCILSTGSSDWNNILSLQKNSMLEGNDTSHLVSIRARVGFGLQPQEATKYFHEVRDGNPVSPHDDASCLLYSKLESLLYECPDAIIGEIGLDRSILKTKLHIDHLQSVSWSWKCQQAAFDTQMRLGHDLRRPVSIRIVKAYGYLEKYLKSRLSLTSPSPAQGLPPKIVLSSYSGGVQLVNHLTSLCEQNGTGLYFGVSNRINVGYYGTSPCINRRLQEVIAAIPDDRILIESDSNVLEDGHYYFNDCVRVHNDLVEVVYAISLAKGWTAEETISKVAENASIFHCIENKGALENKFGPSSLYYNSPMARDASLLIPKRE